MDWCVREREVVRSGKLLRQTESCSYCSLLQFLADCLQRWHGAVLDHSQLLFGPNMQDAITMMDSYWHQYCQMKDWIGQAWFCATLQLFDLSFFGCHIFLLLRSQDADVAKNSIGEDMSPIFCRSMDWCVREGEVVGSGKLLRQTESSSYCSTLLQFLADCLQRWHGAVLDHSQLPFGPTMQDSITMMDSYWHQYCQMKDWIRQAWFCATLQLFDLSFFGCHIFLLLRSQDADVAKNSIGEDMSPISCRSMDWCVREWDVVGSGKLFSQTESSSFVIYIYMVPPPKSLPFSWAKEVMFWKFRFCFGRRGVWL